MNNITYKVSFLPFYEGEELLIDELKRISNSDTKRAQLLVFSNSLLLSNANIDVNDLYNMLINSYLLNKPNSIKEIDFTYYSVKNFVLDSSINKEMKEIYTKSIVTSLMQLITLDNDLKYELAINYVKNMNKTSYQIDEEDLNTYAAISVALQEINSDNKNKENSEHSRIYQKKSNR